MKAVRDAHLIQKSYAVSAIDGEKCVTHFIGRAFWPTRLLCCFFFYVLFFLFFFFLCTWSRAVCAPPPDRWIQWRCTVEPRGWTSSSSSSSAPVPCRWWWTRGPRRSEAREEPGKQVSKSLHKCEDGGVFFWYFFFFNCCFYITASQVRDVLLKINQLGAEERKMLLRDCVEWGFVWCDIAAEGRGERSSQSESHVLCVLWEKLCCFLTKSSSPSLLLCVSFMESLPLWQDQVDEKPTNLLV